MRSGCLAIAMALTLTHGLLLSPAVFASAPSALALPWESITKVLNDPTLPLGWHDASGNSIVFYHLRFGSEQDAVTVLKRARSQGVQIRDRVSLAYFSAVNGKEFALRELTASGVSPNAVFAGESLLMAAAREEQLGVMRLLIAADADVNYKFRSANNPQQWSYAVTYALNAGKYHAARLVLAAGYAPSKGGPAQASELLYPAIAGGSAPAVSYVLDHFSSMDAIHPDGETPLTFAIRVEAADAVVSELLLRGANPCLRNRANESVEELLGRVNRHKKPYDARYIHLRDRLICRQAKR